MISHFLWFVMNLITLVQDSIRKSIRAQGKFLIFVLATFYIEKFRVIILEISTFKVVISTLLSRIFDFHNSKFYFLSRNIDLKSRYFEI